MFTPRYSCRIGKGRHRRGAVGPLFALLLPVVVMLCGFAVNLAYMQLARTELRVATDATGRAAGRAFSEFQSIDAAQNYAASTAPLNTIAGAPLNVRAGDDDGDVEFGLGQRANGGTGRYVFSLRDIDAVRNGSQKATAVRITGRRDETSAAGPIPLLFQGFAGFSDFRPTSITVSTQVDRDIALVLDRSGSMAEAVIDYDQFWSWIYGWYREYGWYYDRGWRYGWHWEYGWHKEWTDPLMEAEYDLFVEQYEAWEDGGPAPDASRWKALVAAVNEFLDVLDVTDQEELVSLSTFSTSARADLLLQSEYSTVRNEIDEIRPSGWTAVGQGLNTGVPSLFDANGRPYAAKTIVVLTDGINNQDPDPIATAQSIVDAQNVIIHTITFSHEANQTDMATIAEIGNGKHYHAENAAELMEIFRQIANNLPTVITQ